MKYKRIQHSTLRTSGHCFCFMGLTGWFNVSMVNRGTGSLSNLCWFGHLCEYKSCMHILKFSVKLRVSFHWLCNNSNNKNNNTHRLKTATQPKIWRTDFHPSQIRRKYRPHRHRHKITMTMTTSTTINVTIAAGTIIDVPSSSFSRKVVAAVVGETTETIVFKTKTRENKMQAVSLICC